jgi:hypothetical protein
MVGPSGEYQNHTPTQFRHGMMHGHAHHTAETGDSSRIRDSGNLHSAFPNLHSDWGDLAQQLLSRDTGRIPGVSQAAKSDMPGGTAELCSAPPEHVAGPDRRQPQQKAPTALFDCDAYRHDMGIIE